MSGDFSPAGVLAALRAVASQGTDRFFLLKQHEYMTAYAEQFRGGACAETATLLVPWIAQIEADEPDRCMFQRELVRKVIHSERERERVQRETIAARSQAMKDRNRNIKRLPVNRTQHWQDDAE